MSVVYSPLKVFAFADRFGDRQGPLAAPVHIRIKPTNACNQNCWYCAYRVDHLALGSEMEIRDRIPREKMLEIAGDAIAMGVRAVTFSGGGEPLVYPYLAETVRMLGEGGVAIGCLTNGAALRGDAADALGEWATWVRISIDAWDDESYAKSRSVRKGTFERVLENIDAFSDASDRCTIGISFIVTRENAPHIAEFCRLAYAVGAQHVKLSACVVANDVAENNAYHAEIADLVADQIAIARELEGPSFTILDHYHSLPERFVREYDWCPMLQILTVIGADLSVYTCQDKAYTPSGVLGSIRDRSFRTFWSSPETAARVRSLDPRESCRHHCVSNAKNLLLHEYLALDPDHAAFA
ncbi:MAG: radical SAM protein [Candidatus Eremiobacteraeota bacterium]|nr:radical SAM protein [Candidatus Eremiobacteraeota bacterium]